MTKPEEVSPSITLRAFKCPHCFAFTTQTWRSVAVSYADKDILPFRIRNAEEFKKTLRNFAIERGEGEPDLPEWIDRLAPGVPSVGANYNKTTLSLDNVDVSECYHCSKLAVWVGDIIVWPSLATSQIPNSDMPEEIQADFKEAGEIVNSSPRGSAAILRLCIQKLCKHLGEPGKNINDDIKSLVEKGLDPRVQQMMDTLRIFGNNAVHPGELDLKDDRDSAQKLFSFVNMIVEITISQPKLISEMYGKIGTRQIEAIAKRDLS